jgi:hypothetical protein
LAEEAQKIYLRVGLKRARLDRVTAWLAQIDRARP